MNQTATERESAGSAVSHGVTRAGGAWGARRSRRGARPVAVLASAALLLAACTAGDDDEELTDPGSTGVEEVAIPAEGMDLEGTLYLPEGEEPADAVVLVHGSGPHSRDGAMPGQLGLTLPQPVEVYRELAQGLQERGYAVLTWDKRTCGGFNGCAENDYPVPPQDLMFSDLGADTGAALDFLAARPDIAEVAVVGQSKGGTYAADLLDQREDISALVLLAAPAVPITTGLRFQAEKMAELTGAIGDTSPAAMQAVAELAGMADQVEAIAEGDLEGEDVAGASRQFWASWIEASQEAPARVAAAGLPTLALGGEYDWNVPPEHVEAWRPHLPDDGEVHILPNLTHALTYLGTDDVTALGPADLGTEVDATVMDTVAGWLDQVFSRS